MIHFHQFRDGPRDLWHFAPPERLSSIVEIGFEVREVHVEVVSLRLADLLAEACDLLQASRVPRSLVKKRGSVLRRSDWALRGVAREFRRPVPERRKARVA